MPDASKEGRALQKAEGATSQALEQTLVVDLWGKALKCMSAEPVSSQFDKTVASSYWEQDKISGTDMWMVKTRKQQEMILNLLTLSALGNSAVAMVQHCHTCNINTVFFQVIN